MKHGLLAILSALSLLSCLALIALGVRSYFTTNSITHVGGDPIHRRSSECFVSFGRGTLFIRHDMMQFDTESAFQFWQEQARQGWSTSSFSESVGIGNAEPHFGFSYGKRRENPQTVVRPHPLRGLPPQSEHLGSFVRSNVDMAIPQWPFSLTLLVLGIPALLKFRKRLLQRRRQSSGHCPTCDYDLRATPGRCPECGRETKSLVGGK